MPDIKFPTEEEILDLIAAGAKCPSCKKNSAEIGEVLGVPMVGMCHSCLDKAVVEYKKTGPVRGYQSPDLVHSVWEAPGGELIPVNKKGDVINPVHAKYNKQKGKKPLF